MKHRYGIPAFIVCIILFIQLPSTYAYGESSPQDTHELLQKSLSIVEIDHEIERIGERQKQLDEQRQALSLQLQEQEEQIHIQQDRAGAVVRSYYTGERDSLLMTVLGARSFKDLFILFDYYQIIMGRDQAVLDKYQDRYRSLQQTSSQISQTRAELSELKINLQHQRERVLALQKEVDGKVAASGDAAVMQKLMDELTSYWENIGIYEVKHYFKALAAAMQNLPQFIQEQNGGISTTGKTYTIRIEQDELNTFLRSQNPIFEDFAFEFEKDRITASGQRDQLQLSIEGHYTVENEPQNSIRFHVDKLVFNQLELPDTTRRMLEREFDLGFYPQKILSFVKATEVSTSEGILEVKLAISF
ncbi:coiled-coil domain-containing protein [Paenibacillus sp. NPDC056933]|uniref:coiled-coil domain-containing protein n=1 Tax=Paenibacillus sp. NPDC056933 TaxID=3345968 RepID=UPI00364117BF